MYNACTEFKVYFCQSVCMCAFKVLYIPLYNMEIWHQWLQGCMILSQYNQCDHLIRKNETVSIEFNHFIYSLAVI